jgi:hypothetical protein
VTARPKLEETPVLVKRRHPLVTKAQLNRRLQLHLVGSKLQAASKQLLPLLLLGSKCRVLPEERVEKQHENRPQSARESQKPKLLQHLQQRVLQGQQPQILLRRLQRPLPLQQPQPLLLYPLQQPKVMQKAEAKKEAS